MKYFILPAAVAFFCLQARSQPVIDSGQLMQDVKSLSSDAMQGRRTGTRGSRLAQFYILQRFKETGLQPLHDSSYEYPFFFEDKDGQKVMGTNLLALIPGKKSDIIVISAHYDHLGISATSVNGDSIYNGADDNASGVAGLLALAAYFQKHPPEHTLVLAAFDAEEENLKGSDAFVHQFPELMKRIRLNINMDMISHNDKGELYACGTRQYPFLKSFLSQAAQGSPVHLLFGHDDPSSGSDNWIDQSDQGSFYAQKIPFIYFGVEDHPDYHRVSDEFKTISPSFFYHATEIILYAAMKIDRGLSNIQLPPKSKWVMPAHT